MKQINKNIMLCSALMIQGGALQMAAQEARPNIIWITCEDISPYMHCYGDNVVKTPNIDQLAKEGRQFQSMYTAAGVSAPSRSGIITGMYPTSIGTQHMRTSNIKPTINEKTGVPNYSAVIPSEVRCFPEYLRTAGYYTSNNMKTDYQFNEPVTVWDECDGTASYRDCPKGKPFFSVFNLFITHESQLFKRSRLFEGHEDLIVDPAKVVVPPYYKDTQAVREAIAMQLSNVQLMDYHMGEIIKQLKADGVYDNSYVFFFSDHGGTLPWSKREVLERGTHIPFIVKYPGGKNAGTTDKELHSSIDLAPSILSLAGVNIPSYMQGQAFLGAKASKKARKYVFAARDRMDERYDRVRSVRDNRYRYIYNYMPNQLKYQDIAYRMGIPMMKEMLELHKEGKLNADQDDWFKPTKPVEELYDVENDPHELHNLASDPRYAKKLKELRNAFNKWTKEVGDMSAKPEKQMVADWWNGKDKAPVTSEPVLNKSNDGYTLACNTEGASIGYRIIKAGTTPQQAQRIVHTWDMPLVFGFQKNGNSVKTRPVWNVYTKGSVIKLNPGDRLIVKAQRIGYDVAEKTFDIK